MLLDRVEDSATGAILVDELNVAIPADRVAQAAGTAAEFSIDGHYPFVDGAGPMTDGTAAQLIARTWHPTLSVTGAGGMPLPENAGNVLRPFTELRLSFRLPPTCDHEAALAALERTLTTDPPYGAKVTFEHGHSGPGWNAPTFAPWLQAALDHASQQVFGKPSRAFGEGGTIPFMGMLGNMFPEAQFVITGVLGPGTNAHGPNEYLHLPTAQRLTGVLALLLGAHATRG
jgi:acetylornithine deacetylase/succinyl-diaminopimelate desuccinylase-like protein